MSDLEVKSMDLEKLYIETKRDLGELHCPATAFIIHTTD